MPVASRLRYTEARRLSLAWTIIPTLIVVVLFLATARVIHAIQDAPEPASAVEVTAIGHQYWWEFTVIRSWGSITANELHIPRERPWSSDADNCTCNCSRPIPITAFGCPSWQAKRTLFRITPNRMWMDPQRPGVFVGQCAQYCGIQHAKMLLRVSVDGPEDFAAWVRAQQKPAVEDAGAIAGRRVFQRNACMNCHAVGGTSADGRFGPGLPTHLMSRDTISRRRC